MDHDGVQAIFQPSAPSLVVRDGQIPGMVANGELLVYAVRRAESVRANSEGELHATTEDFKERWASPQE